ncbi:MAG: hypothetical protein OXC44_03365 [Proteobacteria bacterium]|nr:hypothetical protein [Pseudomonadota bacterium]
MAVYYACMRETFTILRRDKVFIPMFVGLVILFFLATFISEWSLDNPRIIYFNMTQTMIRLTGGAIAILFGTKMLHDSYISGSLETILSRPINRSVYLLGSYSALVLCFLLYSIGAGLSWWVINKFFFNSAVTLPTEFIFWGCTFAFIEWCVLGAVAFTFASLCRFGLAILSTLLLWVVGLLSGVMSLSLEGLTDSYSLLLPVVHGVAKFWSFDRFTLISYSRNMHLPDTSFLINCVGYGLLTASVLLVFSHIFFNTRDIMR